MKKCYIKTYYGYGDNIWQLSYIEELAKYYDTIYLETYFSFLFEHLNNIKFVKPKTDVRLLTCKKSLDKYKDLYEIDSSEIKNKIEEIEFPYYLSEFKKGRTIPEAFNSVIEISNENLNKKLTISKDDLKEAKKIYNDIKSKTNKKICIIRPPSNRTDWSCSSRIPNPEYFQYIIDNYNDEYCFVSIADKNQEDIKHLENIEYRFENGELDLSIINAFTSLVDLIVTYNCFFFPLGVKLGIKTLVINGGFADPQYYIDMYRTDLTNIRILTPIPNCNCYNRRHSCNKEIELDRIDYAIKSLCNIPPIKKKNLLICRIRAYRCKELINNSLIKKHFNFFTIDHCGIENYREIPEITESYILPRVDEIERIKEFYLDILQKHNIDFVINAQPLYPYNEILKECCNELDIDSINYETFFDDKWVLDKIGGQYTKDNEINKYIDKIQIPENYEIKYPQSSREPQPDLISRQELFSKYNLDLNSKYIVTFGQLMWDMSLLQNISDDIKTVKEYYQTLFESNKDTYFLFKIHPRYKKDHEDMKFLNDHSNVIIIDESLETLFNNFEYFTSFSSHCVFEALIRKKRIATIGYHYCNHSELVYQLKDKSHFENLYEKLNNFTINLNILQKYMYFICNLYTIASNDIKMYDRLTKSSDEFFIKKEVKVEK